MKNWIFDLKKEKGSKRVDPNGSNIDIQCSNHGGGKHPKEGAKQRS